MLINFLLFLCTLFMFSGLALDVGIVQLRKLQMQHAADAAALGAVYEMARGQSDWVAAGKADAALNGFTDGANGVTVTIQNPPTSGIYSGNMSAIRAKVTQSFHTAFLGLVSGSANANPGADSTAMPVSNPNCSYLMGSGSGYYPLLIQSNSSVTSACGVYVDSTSKSIDNTFGSTLTVSGGHSILVRGTSSGAMLSGATSPSPLYSSANQNDPLAAVTAPVFSSCTYTNKSITSATFTLNPGTYCNGITLNHANVTLKPGLYILTGASAWSNNSTVTGTGITIYITQGGGYGFNYFTIANTTINLTAPTSGSLTGIVVFGDRAAIGAGMQGIQISASNITTDGIWYILNTGILFGSSSTVRGTRYIGFVTDNLVFTGATLQVPSPDYSLLTGGSPFPGGSPGGIVE